MQEREITVRLDEREFSFPMTVETDPATGMLIWAIDEWSDVDGWVEMASGRAWGFALAAKQAAKAAVRLGY